METSVVITYYNSSPFYFRKCLDSVLAQSYKDFEAIIVCNEKQSKPYWEKIKKEYQKCDSRIKFVSTTTKGASAARNYGISLCKGKYLSIIDGDDYVENDFLEKMINCMKERNVDICICGVVNRYYPVLDITLDKKVFFSMPGEFAKLQYINFSVNKIYKMSIIKEYSIKFPEKIILGEDAIFLSQYYKYCKHMTCIGDGLYHYLSHNTSLTRSYNPKYYDYEKDVIGIQYVMFTQFPLCKIEREALYNWLFEKLLYISWYYYSENYLFKEKAEQIFLIPEMNELLHSDYLNNRNFNKYKRKVIGNWKKKKMSYKNIKKIIESAG